jgi:hypothetical protein
MYKVIYHDGTIFKGGTLENSKWLKVKDGIKEVKYTFPVEISMSGYKEYNHLVEKQYINGKLNIVAFLLMGKNGANVDIKRFDLATGTLTECNVLSGKEYNDGPTTGWKKG